MTVSASDAPIDTGGLLSKLDTDGAGAIVSFLGIVRSENEGEEVLSLEFEAWEEKLPEVLMRIGRQALEQNNLHSISITHRTGVVLPGEVIVCIFASSPHRAEAFDGCSWTIDEFKAASAYMEEGKHEIWLLLDRRFRVNPLA